MGLSYSLSTRDETNDKTMAKILRPDMQKSACRIQVTRIILVGLLF